MAAVSKAIRDSGYDICDEVVHTGQHYDYNMSDVFFSELHIPKPINLGVGSGTHNKQTAAMLDRLDDVLTASKPDVVLTYGDTNSTLAGALAANKRHFKIAHVEAGLRTYEKYIAEEVNRIVADYVADLLFCPSLVSVQNLAMESIVKGVLMVGDVMYDIFLGHQPEAEKRLPGLCAKYTVEPKQYYLVTTHRAENTDNIENLKQVISALVTLSKSYQILMPLHPRTRKTLSLNSDILTTGLKIIDPVSYDDMLALQKGSRMIITDSGGVQKEAYWSRVPCITMTSTDAWVELTQYGCNTITGPCTDKILAAALKYENAGLCVTAPLNLYGCGNAANQIVDCLFREYG